MKHIKYKARVVTRGFQQIHGIDSDESPAQVINYSTLRMFLALGAIEDLEMHEMDFKTTFLNDELTEYIFMTQAEGYANQMYLDYVCNLRKALNGLKQGPRIWFEKNNDYLCKYLCFEIYPYDPCLYVKIINGCLLVITMNVDALLITGNSPKLFLNLRDINIIKILILN